MLKLRAVLLNSKAAIDLASIMVGIIVIGLIGGVIAATVFAVIPWAQDNAAKQQLESIHTAQNAGFGLSSDPSRTLTPGQQRNSFTNSQGLANGGLLTLSPTGAYCTANFENTDGSSNYIGWVKSDSGKIFHATNNNKTPKTDTSLTTLPCVTGAETTPVTDTDKNELPAGSYNPDPTQGGITPGQTTPGTGNGGTTNPPSPTPEAPTITTTAFPTGMRTMPYNYTVTVTGTPKPTFTATGLNPGLTLNPETGVISGTPTTAGTRAVTITATNSEGSATFSRNLTISPYSEQVVLWDNAGSGGLIGAGGGTPPNAQQIVIPAGATLTTNPRHYSKINTGGGSGNGNGATMQLTGSSAQAIINIPNVQPGTYRFTHWYKANRAGTISVEETTTNTTTGNITASPFAERTSPNLDIVVTELTTLNIVITYTPSSTGYIYLDDLSLKKIAG